MACSMVRAPLLGNSARGVTCPTTKNVPARMTVGRLQVVRRRSLGIKPVQGELKARRDRALTARAGVEGEDKSAEQGADEESEELGEEDTNTEQEDAAGAEVEQPQRRPRRRGPPRGRRAQAKGPQLDERVVQINRVTKVVKGGKQMSFRAVIIVGDRRGRVGVGMGKGKEVIQAVQKASKNAKENMITVNINSEQSVGHEGSGEAGAAKVLLFPAGNGTGVIAGGSVRTVLELAGYRNIFGKQRGSPNPLNNARATIEALKGILTAKEVARLREMTLEEVSGKA